MNCFNFLKLCKLGWYENSLFHTIVNGFYVRIGHFDPKLDKSIYSIISNKDIYVQDEISKKLTHSIAGVLSTCNNDKDKNSSEFFITLGRDLSRFDSLRTIFGVVAEGMEIINEISKEYVDQENRPMRNIRVLKTIVLNDPFPDPNGFYNVASSFTAHPRQRSIDRFEDDEVLQEIDIVNQNRINEELKMKHNAEILELLGDIPDMNLRPPDTTLFICKMHPKTNEDGLKIVFSRFGEVTNVDVIRNKNGNSKCYGFVEFSKPFEAENAYKLMQNAAIDHRKVLVDFCQSLKGRNTKKEN